MGPLRRNTHSEQTCDVLRDSDGSVAKVNKVIIDITCLKNLNHTLINKNYSSLFVHTVVQLRAAKKGEMKTDPKLVVLVSLKNPLRLQPLASDAAVSPDRILKE